MVRFTSVVIPLVACQFALATVFVDDGADPDALSLLQLAVRKDERTDLDTVEPEPAVVFQCPCTNGLSLTLKTPQYSNLGGAGPDTVSPAAILYPDAGVIEGKVVSVKLWTEDSYAGKSKMNGVKGSLGRFNMKVGQEATFKIAIVDAQSGGIVPVASDLPMTFLDLDEGKNGKGRASLTVCNAEQFKPDASELQFSEQGECSIATSTTPGTAKDNPDSVEGALTDPIASKRVVSYMISAGDDGAYSFTINVAKGFGFRNFLFTLTPGAACTNEENMPEGCAAALDAEEPAATTAAPTTTPAPTTTTLVEEQVTCERGSPNECPAGTFPVRDYYECKRLAQAGVEYPANGQRTSRWERGENFGAVSKFPYMPPGCVLYVGWRDGFHESQMVWNALATGKNDGNRCMVCTNIDRRCPGWPAEPCPKPEDLRDASNFQVVKGANECPSGYGPIPDYRTCKDNALAGSFTYGSLPTGRWEKNKGEQAGATAKFPFMPPGCVMYTHWTSGQHASQVFWNSLPTGKNDGMRGLVCMKNGA